MRDAWVLFGIGAVATAAMMLASSRPEAREPREPFIAFTPDFQGFERWDAFSIPANPKAEDAHARGPRTVYVSQRPRPGDVRFPTGTIIVKTIEIGPRAEWPVFAMVKRGGDYNKGGARGWEWFQLALDGRAGPRIVWRGTGAPNGEAGYGSGTDCNLCHMEWAAHNDAVQAKELALERLAR